jgi:hypothetical protein
VNGIRARREQRIGALQDLLRLLYGPLPLTNQNQELFRLVSKIQDAHAKYFGTTIGRDEAVQAAAVQAAENTTNLGNMYVRRVVRTIAHRASRGFTSA